MTQRKAKDDVRPNYPHGRMPMKGFVIIDGVYVTIEAAKAEERNCCIWKEFKVRCDCKPPTARQLKAAKALKEQVK